METVGIEPTSVAAWTNGVYRLSRRFGLVSRVPTAGRRSRETSPFDFPAWPGRSWRVSPLLTPGLPTVGEWGRCKLPRF